MKSAYIEVKTIANELNETGQITILSAEDRIKHADNSEHDLLVQALIVIADMLWFENKI